MNNGCAQEFFGGLITSMFFVIMMRLFRPRIKNPENIVDNPEAIMSLIPVIIH